MKSVKIRTYWYHVVWRWFLHKFDKCDAWCSFCYQQACEENTCGVTGLNDEHSPECKYLGNDMWDCGKLDNQI